MLCLLFLMVAHAHALIGYDCGGQHLNVSTVSLLGAGDCNFDVKTPNNSDVYIQLLQLSDYNYAEVIQCKVEIIRTIYYCGMHSHISAVHNGQAEYLEETMGDRCLRMHQDGTLNLGAHGLINNIKQNRTVAKPVILAGTLGVDGKCKGTQYSDPYGTWSDVVVQAVARISLRSSYVPVRLSSGKIFLKSGTTCDLRDGYCIDPDHGYTFWKPMPTSSCDFHQYDVLYEGIATKFKDETIKPHPPTVYSLTTEDITFALMTTTEQQLCGYHILRTEHPKLFIVEIRKGDAVKPRTDIPVDNLDIFTYVNSKFVYVEKHIRNQMTSLYHNVIQQRCELEKEVIKNTLSLASLLPDEFAYRLMRGPGYMAVTAGEAVHIVKCVPVDTVVRKTEECYTELPVTFRNVSLFLTPKSRILTKFGTQRECSHELPTLYQIEDTWVQFTPEPHVRQLPPQQLQPMTKISWTYLIPGPLAVSGIYSKQDIDKLRDHIMFPAEKPALLNSVARGITGYTTGANTANMYDMLNEDALNKIAQTTASRIWGGFITFGSATAGILGIFIIIRVIKIIIDTAIHGYALHMAYGCSLHLLGAIWSSLTHLLLHLAHRPPQRNSKLAETPSQGETELKLVTSQPNTNTTPTAPKTDIKTYVKPLDSNYMNVPSQDTSNYVNIQSQDTSNYMDMQSASNYVNMQPYTSTEYRELSKRLDELEQIPMSPSGLCSKNRREM